MRAATAGEAIVLPGPSCRGSPPASWSGAPRGPYPATNASPSCSTPPLPRSRLAWANPMNSSPRPAGDRAPFRHRKIVHDDFVTGLFRRIDGRDREALRRSFCPDVVYDRPGRGARVLRFHGEERSIDPSEHRPRQVACDAAAGAVDVASVRPAA